MKQGSWSRLLPWIVLVGLGMACFARLLAEPTALIVDGERPSLDFARRGGVRPLGNDLTFLFLPHHLHISKMLADFGRLPSWDASGFGGRPMIGNPQSGVFYPPVWLAWWIAHPATLGWLTFCHLLWGGLGFYILARGEGLSRLSATVAAGTFQASPYFMAQVFEGHYPHVWAGCWFPWAIWAWKLDGYRRVGKTAVAPFILALTYFTGHPQEWLFLILTILVWTSCDAAKRAFRGQARDAGWQIVHGGVIVAASLLLIAIELIPSWELSSWVSRESSDLSENIVPNHYHLHLVNALQLLTPLALGSPHDYFGPDNYWETVLSIGIGALILAVIGAPWRKDRRRSLSWLTLVLVAIWFAGGRELGFYGVVYRHVPGMNWFRAPARALFLANLGAAMLTGYGMEVLKRAVTDLGTWRRIATRVLVGSMLVLTALVAADSSAADPFQDSSAIQPTVQNGLARRDDSASMRTGLRADQIYARSLPKDEQFRRAASRVLSEPTFLTTLVIIAGFMGIGCLPGPWPVRQTATILIGLCSLGELGIYAHSLLNVTPAESFFGPDPIGEALLLLEPGKISSEPPRIRARDDFYFDLQAIRYGIEKTNINDAFQLEHARSLYARLYPVARRSRAASRLPMAQAVDLHWRTIRQAIFDRLGVSYLVSDRPESDPDWPVVSRGTSRDKEYVIQRNPTALPRAYVVPRAEVVDNDGAAVLSRFRSSDPRTCVLMHEDPLLGLSDTARQQFTPATWSSRDPDRPELGVRTNAPGLLVISDTWMPGWHAMVDDRPVRIWKGNVAQRVIPLERPGFHRIRLEYQPPGFILGAMISVTSGLVLILVATFLPMRRRFFPRDRGGVVCKAC